MNFIRTKSGSKHDFYNIFLVIILTSLCLGCVTSDRRTKPDFGLNGLMDGDPYLASAALAAEYIPDIFSESYLLTRISGEYLRRGQPDLAREILRRAELLSLKKNAANNRYQLQTELARCYLLLGDSDKAHQLLQEALNQCLTLTNEEQRGLALESIIEQGFTSPVVFTDVLRLAIDYVYVLQDPIKRVERLTRLGQKYQEVNSRNRADNLTQQAISAAASINNPWARARAYVQIAKRYIDEKEADSANKYIDLAQQSINSVDVLAISPGDTEILLDLVVNLADAGKLREAMAAVAILPSESLKVNAQLTIIDRGLKQKAELQTRLLVQRLLNQLASLDPNSQSELSLSALVRLGEIYIANGRAAESLRYTQACLPYLSSDQIPGIPAYRGRLAVLFIKNNQIDEAIAGASLITDAWTSSQTLLQIADYLFQHKELITKNRSNLVRSLMIEAEQLAAQSSYLRESALADVATMSFKTGDDIRAIRILNEISNKFLIGKTFLDASANRPINAAISQEARAKLEQLWQVLLRQMPVIN